MVWSKGHFREIVSHEVSVYPIDAQSGAGVQVAWEENGNKQQNIHIIPLLARRGEENKRK